MAVIDQPRWETVLRRADWYLALRDEYEGMLAEARATGGERARQIADEVYGFFEEALARGTISLGADGPAWDAEREPIDTAVIHHTNLPPGISRARIEAIHLTRIYARYYADPAPVDAAIRGMAIHSGHIDSGRQVFYGYHWLVRTDGRTERLLPDEATGWHAGDWPINCRSVGICLDGSFERTAPPPAMTTAVRALLATYGDLRVLGHREVNPTTSCPGATFPSWRARIH